MNKRTFILQFGDKDGEHHNSDDVINLLTVRILETYLICISKTEIPFEVVGDLRKLVSEKILKNSQLKMYSVEIDFENDIVV